MRSFVLLAEFPFAVCLSACVSYLLLLVFHLSLATLSIYIRESFCSEVIASLLEIHIPVPPLRGGKVQAA